VLGVSNSNIVHCVRCGSHDHNAKESKEQSLVEARLAPLTDLWMREGEVVYLVGELQVTRALGDFYLKDRASYLVHAKTYKQVVTTPPQVLKLSKKILAKPWNPIISRSVICFLFFVGCCSPRLILSFQ
jgi:hypothetical protein